MLIPPSIVLLCLLHLLTSKSPVDAVTSIHTTLAVPKWQTVVPDTGVVVELTGRNGSWQLQSGDGKYVVDNDQGLKLPSDLLTNLLHAGVIQDPYIDRNFLTQRHVWMGDHAINNDQDHANRTRSWIYTTSFDLPTPPPPPTSTRRQRQRRPSPWTWYLVVEGIKMGASIEMNGVHVGTVTNQFLRYEFKLSETHLFSGESSSSSSTNSSPLHGGDRGGGADDAPLTMNTTTRTTTTTTTTVHTSTRTSAHNLTVAFDPTITVDGRFAACSGGWDWAPYTKSDDSQGKRSYTLGIVKPMYLIAVQDVAIHHVVPKIYYQGPHPREPLDQDHPAGDFELELNVHINVLRPTGVRSKEITMITPQHQTILSLDWLENSTIRAGENIVTANFNFRGEDIDLWWPNGFGSQPLYNIYVGFEQPHSRMLQKRVGFRTVALVTIDESDEDVLLRDSNEQSEGSGSHGMYFRVNGALVLARGANFIPMDQLEGRLSEEAHRIAVRSAADANMNMMRIWGGGMVLPDAFYDACDEEGILLYHDMMFVDEAGHRPVQTPIVEAEIRHLVRSLSSHPAIAVWNGCNECQVVRGTPSEIYATFVMQTVAEEDDTRSIWPSSPSKHGWKTGVYTIDSRPNGRPLSTWGPDDFKSDLETHGPYMRSYSKGFPGVNGWDWRFPYKNTPPKLPEATIGTSFANYFNSEFGASVMSSAESMEGTLSPRHWSVHGNSPPDTCEHSHGNENTCSGTNVLAERNYPCDTHIVAYFGNSTNLDGVGEVAFQEQMYHCLMGQALWMKGEIEARRSDNSYGILIWQMNENWPTGGWGCVEYGPSDKNNTQVVGGRWKPLMHLLESSLFRDVMAACGTDNRCYVRNDGRETLSAEISFEAWEIGNAKPTHTLSYSILLKAEAIHRLSLPPEFTKESSAVLIEVGDSASERQILESTFLSKHPKEVPGLSIPVSIVVEAIERLNGNQAEIRLKSDQLALFVVLTTRAQGRFSENAFILRPMETKSILFVPMMEHGEVDLDQLRRTLRVEHLGHYLASTNIITVGDTASDH